MEILPKLYGNMIAGFGRDFFETDNMYFQGKYKNSEKMGSVLG